MRARFGLLFAGLLVELREIILKNKPDQMLAISPKGTVPVLQRCDGAVVEESREIMVWALRQQDPQGLLDATALHQANALIEQNDNEFKHWLDRYKYADRYLEMSQSGYRQRGEVFLQVLETLRTKTFAYWGITRLLPILASCLLSASSPMWIAMFFTASLNPNLYLWLQHWLEHPFFLQVMTKFRPWQEGDDVVVFPSWH
jgi:glutathione S-transferase